MGPSQSRHHPTGSTRFCAAPDGGLASGTTDAEDCRPSTVAPSCDGVPCADRATDVWANADALFLAPVTPATDGAASFRSKSCDSKLSPVEKRKLEGGRGLRLTPKPPFCCSTYTSIAGTCSDGCPFRSEGCYVQTGATVSMARTQDEATRGRSAIEVIAEEVMLIDRAFGRGVPKDGARGGRDLRLHVGGDVGSASGAQLLAGAACRWRAREGGTVWTYSHLWREIPRADWGPDISVLASVETAADIEVARRAGYPAAIVLPKFPSKGVFQLPGSTAKIIPCPAGKITPTGKRVTCVSCRLCLDHDLLWMKAAIGFAAHGPGAGKVVEALAQIRLRKIGSLGDSGDEHEHQRDHGGQCVEGAGQDQGGHHASR